MSTNDSPTQNGSDDELPAITTHREPRDLGGALYARCQGCGAESVHGAHSIIHREHCPHAEADR
jgi:hypothetical protein